MLKKPHAGLPRRGGERLIWLLTAMIAVLVLAMILIAWWTSTGQEETLPIEGRSVLETLISISPDGTRLGDSERTELQTLLGSTYEVKEHENVLVVRTPEFTYYQVQPAPETATSPWILTTVSEPDWFNPSPEE